MILINNFRLQVGDVLLNEGDLLQDDPFHIMVKGIGKVPGGVQVILSNGSEAFHFSLWQDHEGQTCMCCEDKAFDAYMWHDRVSHGITFSPGQPEQILEAMCETINSYVEHRKDVIDYRLSEARDAVLDILRREQGDNRLLLLEDRGWIDQLFSEDCLAFAHPGHPGIQVMWRRGHVPSVNAETYCDGVYFASAWEPV